MRYTVNAARLVEVSDGGFEVRADFVLFKTLPGEQTQVLMAGTYFDRIVSREGQLKFMEKLCVYDTALIPASLISPV